MDSIPLGGLFFACCTLMAVTPIRRPRPLATASWIVSAAPNELPFCFIYIVVASSAPSLLWAEIIEPEDVIASAVALLTIGGLGIVTRRALSTGTAVEAALERGLGVDWWAEIDSTIARRLGHRRSWTRILLFPWPFRPRSVERSANIAYGDRGTENLLDVYRHRSRPSGAPTLIHLHGGRFKTGRKNFESRPLIHHLASRGWTCISANYHLAATPQQGFPDHLVDVKRVITWARTAGRAYGVDPDMIFLAGSSAGAHLTAMAALTVNDPAFQPGFEHCDTTIAAGIGLYGYYGGLGGDGRSASSPLTHVSSAARPLFIAHGDHDTYTPVAGAREFVDGVRAKSSEPVVYAELPGAQHSFDLFHSIRFGTTVDAIEAFAAWIRSTRITSAPRPDPTLPRQSTE